MVHVPGFRALSGKELRALLETELGYLAVKGRGKGSHQSLRSPGRPQLTWALGKRDLAAVEGRNILVKDVGLTLEQAKEVIARG
jgi:hypothetical protein